MARRLAGITAVTVPCASPVGTALMLRLLERRHHRLGPAGVAMSISSIVQIPSSVSRTQPPTKRAAIPAALERGEQRPRLRAAIEAEGEAVRLGHGFGTVRCGPGTIRPFLSCGGT